MIIGIGASKAVRSFRDVGRVVQCLEDNHRYTLNKCCVGVVKLIEDLLMITIAISGSYDHLRQLS